MANDSQELKSAEFYSASVHAWYNTSLEHDKSINSSVVLQPKTLWRLFGDLRGQYLPKQ